MKSIKKRPILFTTIIILFITVMFFGKTTIEETEYWKEKYTDLEKSHKELSILLSNKNNEKDVEIIEEKKADGSYKKVKRVRSKKTSSISSVNSTEDFVTKKEVVREKEKKRVVVNPKKLNFAVGLDSTIQPYVTIDYMFRPPFLVGGHVKKNGQFGIHIGISF